MVTRSKRRPTIVAFLLALVAVLGVGGAMPALADVGNQGYATGATHQVCTSQSPNFCSYTFNTDTTSICDGADEVWNTVSPAIYNDSVNTQSCILKSTHTAHTFRPLAVAYLYRGSLAGSGILSTHNIAHLYVACRNCSGMTPGTWYGQGYCEWRSVNSMVIMDGGYVCEGYNITALGAALVQVKVVWEDVEPDVHGCVGGGECNGNIAWAATQFTLSYTI